MARGSADFKSIHKKVLKTEKFQNAAYLSAKLKYTTAKKMFFNEFLSHPVTKEIRSGPDSSNISGTLGGYGNLFSFLGFEGDRNPVEEIVEAMQSLFSFRKSKDSPGNISFEITYPDIDKLKPFSSLSWAFGGSWVSGIEMGIPNFAQYLSDEDILNSRSGSGIQAKGVLRGVNFKAVPYLTPILRKFKERIEK